MITKNKIAITLKIATTKILGMTSSTYSDRTTTNKNVYPIINDTDKRVASILFERNKNINVLAVSKTGIFGRMTAAIAVPEFTDALSNYVINGEISIGDYYGENPNQLDAEFSELVSFFNDYLSP